MNGQRGQDEQLFCGDAPTLNGVAEARRPERRDAAERRQRILAVARQLFAEHDVTAVSMHQIAQAAGVGQGTLYRRYAHKGELCLELLRESNQRMRDEIESYLAESAASQPALARLDGFLVRLITFIEEKAHLLGAIDDAFCGDRRAMQFHSRYYQWSHETVTALLRQAVARQELAPLDVTFTGDTLLAALNIDLYLFQRHQRGFTPDQILAGLRRIYIEGLRATVE